MVCLDIEGFKNGNDGPFMDEVNYVKPKGTQDKLNEKFDADIIWMYDMRDQLGVFPHNVTSSSPLIIGDTIFVATSNGVDWSHTNIPSPLSPSWVALDKNSGELIGEDGSGASAGALHAAWSRVALDGAGSAPARRWFGAPDAPVADPGSFFHLKNPLAKRY